jgi:hypothetical protein
VKTILLVLFAAFVSSSSANAQERRAPLPEKLAPATRSSIERLADSLDADRLPGHALRDKAAEGVLKGANDAVILDVVRSLAQRIRDSRVAMGSTASDNELLSAAAAISAGVSPSEISRFAIAQRKRDANVSLAYPLALVTHLALKKVPGAMALSSVETLLTRGASDADFGAFRISVERELLQGRTPRDAVDAGVRVTLRGLTRPPGRE